MSTEKFESSPLPASEAKPLGRDPYLETLERHARYTIDLIFKVKGSSRFRCWEIARLSAGKLRQLGYQPEVNMGKAAYSNRFLQENLVEVIRKKGSVEEVEKWEKWLIEEHHEGWSMNNHSWIKIGDCVVDFQNVIETLKGQYGNVLLVDRLSDLDSKVRYFPVGREIRLLGQTFIHIPHTDYGQGSTSRLRIRNPLGSQ